MAPTRWVEAALKGDEKFLAENPSSIYWTNDDGWTALHYAASHNNDKLVARLLLEAPGLALIARSGVTALHCAAMEGYEKIVTQLLEAHPHLIDVVGTAGDTALHFAARNGKLNAASQLLAANPALMSRLDSSGRSALHYAVLNNHEAVAELLVETKPDSVFVIDAFGENILHFIGFGCRPQFVERVLQWNPQALRGANSRQQTPFQLMVDSNNGPAIEVLQWKLCVDEIVSAFTDCGKPFQERMWPIVKSQIITDDLLVVLNLDVLGLVCEYIISRPSEPPRKKWKLS